MTEETQTAEEKNLACDVCGGEVVSGWVEEYGTTDCPDDDCRGKIGVLEGAGEGQ